MILLSRLLGVRYRCCRLSCVWSNRTRSIYRGILQRKPPSAWRQTPTPLLLRSTERYSRYRKRCQSAELSCEPHSHFRLWAVGSPTLAKPFVVVKICFTGFIQFGSCQNSQGSTTSEPEKPRFSAGV